MNRKNTLILIISIIILALIGGGVFLYFKQSNRPINPPVTENGTEPWAVVESNYEQELEELESSSEPNNNDSTNNTQEAPTADGGIPVSKQVGEYTVFYNWYFPKEHNDKVTVYLDNGSSKTALFQELAFSIGGSRPEFQEVVEPNIVLLTFSNSDSGWSQNNYHYINVSSKKVVSIEDVNLDKDFIKISTQKQIWVISTFIKNECKYFEDGKVKIRDGENTYLTDLTLNDERINVLTKERVLKCIDSGGLGSGLVPYVDLKYLGINKDLSKILFSLNSTDIVEFVFDIGSQAIFKGTLNDLLK